MKRSIVSLSMLALVACGDSSTSPGETTSLLLPEGPYVLRLIASVGGCVAAPDSQPGAPMTSVSGPVTLSRGGSEWVARASGDAGDVEMRFRETQRVSGGARIEGTFRGTLANLSAVTGIPGDTRVVLGSDAAAALNGTALVGPFNTSLINGAVSGSIRFSDGSGRICTSQSASWSLLNAR